MTEAASPGKNDASRERGRRFKRMTLEAITSPEDAKSWMRDLRNDYWRKGKIVTGDGERIALPRHEINALVRGQVIRLLFLRSSPLPLQSTQEEIERIRRTEDFVVGSINEVLGVHFGEEPYYLSEEHRHFGEEIYERLRRRQSVQSADVIQLPLPISDAKSGPMEAGSPISFQ